MSRAFLGNRLFDLVPSRRKIFAQLARNADNFKDAVLADFSDFEANSLQTGRKRQMID
jgi:hypothetical protein